MMNRNVLFWPLAAMLLTACEKGLDDYEDNMSPEASQVTNSMLQVRTRGTSPGEGTSIAYPVQVYVMQGDKCKVVQTIGDEGQTLNIPLVEGAYSVYAIGGASGWKINLERYKNTLEMYVDYLRVFEALNNSEYL